MGRLTTDPEIRYSQGATPVAFAKYGIAVNRTFKKQGEPEADFLNCTVFGKSAEFAGKYFKKGMMVTLSGRIQTRTWEDKDTGQKRYGTDIIVEEQEFAESKAAFESRNGGQGQTNQPQNSTFGTIEQIDPNLDLPF